MQAREIAKQSPERIERRRPRAEPAAHSGVLARAMLGVPMKFGAGSEIYGEGERVFARLRQLARLIGREPVLVTE